MLQEATESSNACTKTKHDYWGHRIGGRLKNFLSNLDGKFISHLGVEQVSSGQSESFLLCWIRPLVQNGEQVQPILRVRRRRGNGV